MSERRNVRTQKLQSFTVQVRHGTDANRIVGTGVVVSAAGGIITCAHVVRDALDRDPRESVGHEVNIYFPQMRGDTAKQYRARVQACSPSEYDDDIVLLQLIGELPPLTPENLALLGTASDSDGNDFRSYGFKQLGEQPDGYAEGTIMGPVLPPSGKRLRVNPLELRTRDVAPGISGAAVLDTQRNLVVGLVARRWNPGDKSANDNIAWAVDAGVLNFDPFNFDLQGERLPLNPAPRPRTDLVATAIQPNFNVDLSRAPRVLPEWVGRTELLNQLLVEWQRNQRRVIGLIGFGGEGKTTLARQWVHEILKTDAPPDGVFWWPFYENNNLDEFFEAALRYLLGDSVNLAAIPSANLRAHVVASLLRAGRYLFVLDGVEVLQHQKDDQYGEFTSPDLRSFLQLFAGPDHGSLCLITSRAPIVDLRDFITYTEFAVERLNAADGRDLLRKLGVHGADAALDEVVRVWDGHALALTLLGTFLVERWSGDVAHTGDVSPPMPNEPHFERVQRVLRRYDDHLGDAERTFLTLFSAFRRPVPSSAFATVFRAPGIHGTVLAALSDEEFAAVLSRLMKYQILRHSKASDYYTVHPLIRTHYLVLLEATPVARSIHTHIREFYIRTAREVPSTPTLDDLAPLLEAIHHMCRAGLFDEALEFYRKRVDQGQKWLLTHVLGAWETELSMLFDFFPAFDSSKDPQVTARSEKAWILNEIGLALMLLGRISEARTFLERGNAISRKLEDLANVSPGKYNLGLLFLDLGEIERARVAAAEALESARSVGNEYSECDGLELQARVEDLQSHGKAAHFFAEAVVLNQKLYSSSYLTRNGGIWLAEHHLRLNNLEYARKITEENLELCKKHGWGFQVADCYRVLGEIDAAETRHADARTHFNVSLSVARGLSTRKVLISALLARGRWAARRGDAAEALSDLQEALYYATSGGYRIFEVDIRNALGWAYLGAGDRISAAASVKRALTMSQETGYAWGQLDAQEVIAMQGMQVP